MFRSMTTTSGADSRTWLSASDPFDASATMSTPCSSSRFRRPVRKRSWSSTSRTRIGWRSLSSIAAVSFSAAPPRRVDGRAV
jgi:hypothetical protein